ncbi:MAG: ATP synthase F1 subunit delta [Patescibacteria group bacterium]|jgi:F-type H+-transporting ATPase subunit delta
MKVNTKNYAIALYEAVSDGKGESLKIAAKNFIKILADKNLLGYAPKIMADFQKYYNEKQNIIEVKIETARELSESEKKEITKVMNQATKKETELITSINDELIGGIKLFYADNLIDGSLKNQLAELKQQLLAKN